MHDPQDLQDAHIALARAQTAKELALAQKTRLQVEELEYDAARSHASLDRNRIYRFYNVVTGDACARAIDTMDVWSKRDGAESIVLEFNSPGGSVIDGLALYDFVQELRRRGHHVTTVTRGMAASMGGILLQAGDRRVMDENAHILIHEVSSGARGKIGELEDDVKFSKMLWEERLCGILAERSTMSRRQIINKASRKDWWFGAEDALKLNFVDEVTRFPAFADDTYPA